jgi:hypothetical protein
MVPAPKSTSLSRSSSISRAIFRRGCEPDVWVMPVLEAHGLGLAWGGVDVSREAASARGSELFHVVMTPPIEVTVCDQPLMAGSGSPVRRSDRSLGVRAERRAGLSRLNPRWGWIDQSAGMSVARVPGRRERSVWRTVCTDCPEPMWGVHGARRCVR